MTQKVFRCKNCVMVSTRPRLTFDQNGICSACRWSKKKNKINWKDREKKLIKLLNKHKKINANKSFNCLVPVSGGKDGSYVAHQLKYKYSMKPLCVTINPHLPTEVGSKNLKNFIECGFDHIAVSPDYDLLKKFNRYGFEHAGLPFYGWLVAVHTAVVNVAINFNLKLVFFGEDGELEYGGKSRTEKNHIFNIDYQKEIFTENYYDKILKKIKISKENNLAFFLFEKKNSKELKNLELTHWSSYENWDSYRNYVYAKKHCNLEESESNNAGTFTNFAQNDQALVALHTYMMFLKFGFGRTAADACIEIRRGAMNREQAITLVNIYDGRYPIEFEKIYLEYFNLSKKKFHKILDKWANKKILKKINNSWQLKKPIL
jgi:N-acetyl sugar amidotransferase